MNTHARLIHVAVALACLSAASAQKPVKVAMRDVVTHDQIVEAARKAKEENPQPVFKPAEGADPSVANRPKGLLERSDILCYLGRAALVPKRAVLHIPKELADRVGMKDGAQIGAWTDFLIANRAWIRTVPVTRAHAEGRQSMDEETLKSFAKERRLVIATYQEGPISVTPLRVPPPDPASPAAKSSAPAQAINVSKP